MTLDLIIKILLVLLAYLIGSIPFSIVIGKTFKGIDIREHGSGNPGTTNAMRTLGKPLGLLIFFLDLMKAAIFIILINQTPLFINIPHFPAIYYGVAACVGHVYPVFLNFKGGKAAACGAGMICAMNFWIFAIGMIGFFIIVKVSKYVSLGSCGAALIMAIGATIYVLMGYSNIHFPIGGFLVTLLLVYRHKGNFARILNGTERKSSMFTN